MTALIEAKIASIDEAVAPELGILPFLLLERQSNSTTKLLANSGTTRSIEGRKRPYRFEFKEPVMLSHVEIDMTGYKDYHKFAFLVKTIDGREEEYSEYPKDDMVSLTVDELCTSVIFTPPTAWASSPHFNQVRLFGIRMSEVGKFINFAYDIDGLKNEALAEIQAQQVAAQGRIEKAAEAQSNLDILQQRVAEAASELASTRANVVDETNKLNQLVAKTGATAKQLEATDERVDNLHSEIKVETQRKEQIQKDVTAAEAKLSDLKGNINLFPSEISGFVEQASSNTALYLRYAFGPLFILSAMFLLLISGAVDLSTVITVDQDVNILAMLVSRLPYVAISSAIIYACYRLARLFITEIMNINRQRLSLTKVSIIAKDISHAAEAGLGIPAELVYSNRLKVKMIMLGDHIKHLISSEPELLFPENLFALPTPVEVAQVTRATRRKSVTPKAVSIVEGQAEQAA
jgi:hypothetical protein